MSRSRILRSPLRSTLAFALVWAVLILPGVLETTAFGQETTAAPTTEELLEAARKPGPWKVAKLRERDGIRNGADYRGGTIHYPTGADGSIAGAGPFPIVAICPGYQASEGSVRPWGDFLASHGIVTMTLGTNAPRDLPIARGRALLDAMFGGSESSTLAQQKMFENHRQADEKLKGTRMQENFGQTKFIKP